MDKEEKDRLLLINLIVMFQSLAWQQMGKLKNPLTDKIEQDLEGARNCIDTLEMIREKTKGNLGDEEERILSQALRELWINYVDEVNRQAGPSDTPDTSQAASGKEVT